MTKILVVTHSKNHITENRFFNKNITGFTLVEFLIVIAIIGVIAASSFPSLRDGIAKNTVNKELRELRTGLNIARDSALTLSTTTGLCAGNESGCSGTWRSGWLIFSDPDENGYLAGTDDGIIRVYEGISSRVNEPTITGSGLGFNSQGYALSASTIKLC